MSKVILKVEVDEEAYKQIKGDSVYDNNNESIIGKSSSAYYALNAIINATPLTESDDCVSRQSVLDYISRLLNQGTGKKKSFEFIQKFVEKLPSVTPKHNLNENVKTHYFHTDDYCPKESEDKE